jgi:hypothetical protein
MWIKTKLLYEVVIISIVVDVSQGVWQLFPEGNCCAVTTEPIRKCLKYLSLVSCLSEEAHTSFLFGCKHETTVVFRWNVISIWTIKYPAQYDLLKFYLFRQNVERFEKTCLRTRMFVLVFLLSESILTLRCVDPPPPSTRKSHQPLKKE